MASKVLFKTFNKYCIASIGYEYRTHDVTSHKVSSVLVTMTSGQKVKVTKLLLETVGL